VALFVAVVAIALIVTFLWTPPSPERPPQYSQRESQIKVGGHTTQLGACLKIAEAKEFYRKNGLDATIRLVKSSKQSMAAMEAGDLDVVIGSLSAGSFNLIRKGDLVILADGSRVVPSVIIRKDLWESGQVRQLTALKGVSIRTPREGSSSYYALSKVLRGIGLNIEDIKPKYLKEKEALAALEAKQIDAAILNEPFATSAVERGLGIRYDIEEVEKFFPPKGQQHMVIYTLRKTMKEKPQLLHKFFEAYVEAAKFYDQARTGNQPQRDEAVKIISEYTSHDKVTIEKAVWPYVAPDGKPNVSYINEMHDYFVQKGLVDSPINLDNVIHLEFLPENK